MVVLVLSRAGDQVPVKPFVDEVGSAVRTAPEHIAATGLKVGTMLVLTVTIRVAVMAH